MPTHHLVGRWEEIPERRCPNGLVAKTAPWPRLAAIFSCENGGLRGVVDFLIDTGADQTILMPDDAERIGITNNHLVAGCPSQTRGVGGIGVAIKYLRDVTFEFQAEGNVTTPPITFEQLAVLFPSRDSRRGHSAQSYSGIPSLLGRSFLQQCRIDFSAPAVLLHFED
jgi:predicted aspartyl protease